MVKIDFSTIFIFYEYCFNANIIIIIIKLLSLLLLLLSTNIYFGIIHESLWISLEVPRWDGNEREAFATLAQMSEVPHDLLKEKIP